MNIFLKGVIAGVLGTVAMDLLNYLFARIGLISKIDVATIGRMATGWVHGRFRYGHPSEMEQVTNEMFFGYIAHYCIGVSLALPYVLGWDLLVGRPASPAWTLAYGVATTVASWFFVYPSMGFGVFGWRSPEGIKSTISSLVNHLFFGVGMAIGLIIV
jgi:hypothetical protein